MPNKYLDSVGLAEYTTLVKTELATKLPLSGGAITGNLSVSGTITGNVTGNVTGNADTSTNATNATNATNDANGNPIASTYLKLAGGTMTGNEIISKSAPRLILKDTVIARNTAPSSNYAQVEITGQDKNDVSTWGLYHRYNTDKSHRIDLIAYKGTTTDSSWTGIGVGYDSNGDAYTYAPTPTAGDNSTKIATTAFVHNYLPLSGGTLTGNLSVTTGGNYPLIYTDSDVKRLSIASGSNVDNKGASISLYGQSYSYGGSSDSAGQFMVRACMGSTHKDLIGNPDGTLIWDGSAVQTAKVYSKSLSPASEFSMYSSGTSINVRRIGNVVMVEGVVTPKSELASGSGHTLFTLPSGYRPILTVRSVMQGSSVVRWYFQISTNGSATLDRYGTTSASAIAAGQWIPFSATFLTSDAYPTS